MVLVGGARPARRGAEPDAADLPRARGAASSPSRPARSSSSCRRSGGASTSRRWRATIAGGRRRPRGARLSTGTCPTATRRRCRPRRRPSRSNGGRRAGPRGSSTRRARPPTRRARATPTTRQGGRRTRWTSRSRCSPRTATRWSSRSRTSAGSAGCSRWLMAGLRSVLVESFVPATTIPVLQREQVTLAGAGTAFHLAYLDSAARAADEPDLFPDRAVLRRRRRGQAAAAPLRGEGGARRRRHRRRGYGLTECPILAMAARARHRREARRHRGPRRRPASRSRS